MMPSSSWTPATRGMWMGGFYDLRAPAQGYIRSAGHLGWAFPAGLGAKCACPDRPVVVFTGERWPLVSHRRNRDRGPLEDQLGDVVNNNANGNQSKRGFDRAYGGQQSEQARELWTYRMVNFARVAEDIGALGIRVEKPAGSLLRSSRAQGRSSRDCGRSDRHRGVGADRGDLTSSVSGGRRPASNVCLRRSLQIFAHGQSTVGARGLKRRECYGLVKK